MNSTFISFVWYVGVRCCELRGWLMTTTLVGEFERLLKLPFKNNLGVTLPAWGCFRLCTSVCWCTYVGFVLADFFDSQSSISGFAIAILNIYNTSKHEAYTYTQTQVRKKRPHSVWGGQFGGAHGPTRGAAPPLPLYYY
jgi:hypothetical protein